jgi:hypothetical protein
MESPLAEQKSRPRRLQPSATLLTHSGRIADYPGVGSLVSGRTYNSWIADNSPELSKEMEGGVIDAVGLGRIAVR